MLERCATIAISLALALGCACSEPESGSGASAGGAAHGGGAGAGGGSGSAGSTGTSGAAGSTGSAGDAGIASACDEPGVRGDFSPEYDLLVHVGDDAAASIAPAAQGARIAFEPGVHRIAEALQPKASQSLYGLPGAILSGAKPLSGFVPNGSIWSLEGQTQPVVDDQKPCQAARPLCSLTNDVFIDGVRLEPVASAAEVGSGKTFFDDAGDTLYIGDDPNGHQVEMAVTPLAIDAGGAGVRIENLVVEEFAAPAQDAAVRSGSDWVIEHSEFRKNHGIGVRLGARLALRQSYIHHQGQMGIGGSGEDVVVEGNHLSHNNAAGYDAFWEAGGTKFVYTTNLLVTGNCSHDNDGPGFWTDINNQDTRYESNVAEDNTRAGIFHEISYAAVITGNQCRRNGLGGAGWFVENSGILVTDSSDVEISANLLEQNGIMAVQDDRVGGDFGPWEVASLYVHDNEIGMSGGDSGLALAAITDTIYFSAKNNRFQSNHYTVDQLGQKQWYWVDGAADFPTWQSYGHDTSGSVSAK